MALVDGNSPNVCKGRIGEASAELTFLDFFDHVPVDIEKIGDVLDRHAASELQSVFGPGLSVASEDIGEAILDLANDSTLAALNTRQRGDNDGSLQANRRSSELACAAALADLATAPHKKNSKPTFHLCEHETA